MPVGTGPDIGTRPLQAVPQRQLPPLPYLSAAQAVAAPPNPSTTQVDPVSPYLSPAELASRQVGGRPALPPVPVSTLPLDKVSSPETEAPTMGFMPGVSLPGVNTPNAMDQIRQDPAGKTSPLQVSPATPEIGRAHV